MAGINEILVLILLIASVLVLSRFFKGAPVKKQSAAKKNKNLPVKKRLRIVLTLTYPIAASLYLKPWENNLLVYLIYGIAPVLLFWAVVWIVAGKKIDS